MDRGHTHWTHKHFDFSCICGRLAFQSQIWIPKVYVLSLFWNHMLFVSLFYILIMNFDAFSNWRTQILHSLISWMIHHVEQTVRIQYFILLSYAHIMNCNLEKSHGLSDAEFSVTLSVTGHEFFSNCYIICSFIGW